MKRIDVVAGMPTRRAFCTLLAATAAALPGCGGGSEDGERTVGEDPVVDSVYKIWGVDFGPYADGQDPNVNPAIGESQITQRLQPLRGRVRTIRTYGAADGLERIPAIASSMGFEVWAGAWVSTNFAANEQQIAALIDIGRSGDATGLIVGSEVLLRGDLSEATLLNYIARVRAAVPTNVMVSCADTHTVLMAHPAVMAACDVVMANVHPYFSVAVESAAAMVHAAWQKLEVAAGGKRCIVSEVGWPSAGTARGAAVPSEVNAARFFKEFTSWARANAVDYFWFEAADEAWKERYEASGAHWGLYLKDGRTLKAGMQAVFDGERSADTWTTAVVGGPGTPTIELTVVPAVGSFANVEGQVGHVDPSLCVVGFYIKVFGGWWIKPSSSSGFRRTPIRADGSFSVDYTTGGVDELAVEMVAFLLPDSAEVPVVLGDAQLPAVLDATAIARVSVTRS